MREGEVDLGHHQLTGLDGRQAGGAGGLGNNLEEQLTKACAKVAAAAAGQGLVATRCLLW